MIVFRGFRCNINPFASMLFLLVLFLLVFPKGGFKIGEIPITWGYALIGATCMMVGFLGSWSITLSRLAALFCLIPFQAISLGSIIWHGIAPSSTGWAISFFISFFFFPYVFLLLFSEKIEKMDLAYFLNLVKKGITFISYYGIFLFIYKQSTGKYLEIPFLIVNIGDLGTLDELKCNSRGIVSKLISTYNNGNIFGISMTLLLPLYCYLQKNSWHRFVFKLALLLTLSRTAWIGLILNEIFYSLFTIEKKEKAILYLVSWIILIFGGLSAILMYYDFNISFLLDANLGGRRGQIDNILQHSSFFPCKPFKEIVEMTYISMLDNFGIIGLLTYLLAMAGPLFLYLSKPPSKIRLCILLGLINYLIISFADGAVMFIPVLAFFWILVSLLMRKDLGESETAIQFENEKKDACLKKRKSIVMVR